MAGTPISASPVPYKQQVIPGVKIDMDQHQTVLNAQYLVAATNLIPFLSFCAGVPTILGGVSTIPVPVVYPGLPNLYASKLHAETLPASPEVWGVSTPYSIALVDIEFSSVPYNTDGSSAFRSIQADVAGNFITVPGTAYVFGDGTPSETGSGIFVPEEQYTVTYYRQPAVNEVPAVALNGCVNSDSFALNSVARSAGTVLYAGMSFNYEQSLVGSPMFTVIHKFLWRSISWNNALHPDGSSFQSITSSSGGNTPYATAAFNTYFPGGL